MAILPQSGFAPSQPEARKVPPRPAPAPGYNTPALVAMRRAAILESGAGPRVAAQIEKDRGFYARPPVLPVEYSEGNIKKSTSLIGPAGYNQRAVPLPNSPDDMSQEQYMESMLKGEPVFREKLRMAMSVPFQQFLNQPSVSMDYPSMAHNMANNLLSSAYAGKRSA